MEVYKIIDGSTIQRNHVAFIRNKSLSSLLLIRSNSSAIIQNNTLIENNVSWAVYDIGQSSAIQLNQVTFIRKYVTEFVTLDSVKF